MRKKRISWKIGRIMFSNVRLMLSICYRLSDITCSIRYATSSFSIAISSCLRSYINSLDSLGCLGVRLPQMQYSSLSCLSLIYNIADIYNIRAVSTAVIYPFVVRRALAL